VAQNARAVFGLDLRSLAVFRVALGLILLVDLGLRAVDLNAHYTDEGVLPTAARPSSGAACVHALCGAAWFEAALFVVAGLFAVALAVGWRTRLATFASCFLLVSLHARNPLVVHGGDVLLRALLFWGLFLPLGARWSLDARRRTSGPAPGAPVASAASAALIFQLCFLYWFSAALKTDPVWRTEGTAVYYALSIDAFATPFGHWLLGFPDLLRFLTFATLWLETLGPCLLFIPFANSRNRLPVIVVFVSFHLGLGLALELGNFPYVCAAAWLALLPGGFWDRVAGWLRRRPAAAPAAPPASPPTPRWANVLAEAFLVYVLLWNLRTVDFPLYSTVFPRWVNPVGEAFGLAQSWDLFAPYPMKDDGWYVVAGRLRDGAEVDLFRGGAPVSWDKPELVSATYRNERWRKYLMNLEREGGKDDRPLFAGWLRREWDAAHADDRRVEEIRVYYMLETTRPDYRPRDVERVLLYADPPQPPGGGGGANAEINP
jgi:hypothetical protein